MMNGFHNVSNPYQGKVKRVLCVCSAGLLRSPTAAQVLHKEFGFNTRACGINEEYALIPLTELLLVWADEIVFMEKEHKEEVESEFDLRKKRVVLLSIPDKYAYMDPELQQLIIDRYKETING